MRTTLLTALGVLLVLLPLPADDDPSPSRAGLRKRVGELQVRDVAWRKIPWTSCLLDGLRKARKEKKPLIIWAFIDRPFDDTRC